MKLEFFDWFWKKRLNIKFHQNPFSGSRVVPCGQIDRQDEAVVAFRSFAKAPKNFPNRS
jgi:hypothetical protein